jgi:hypothetical protein
MASLPSALRIRKLDRCRLTPSLAIPMPVCPSVKITLTATICRLLIAIAFPGDIFRGWHRGYAVVAGRSLNNGCGIHRMDYVAVQGSGVGIESSWRAYLICRPCVGRACLAREG